MLCRIKQIFKQHYQCKYVIKLNHIWLQLVLQVNLGYNLPQKLKLIKFIFMSY